MWHFIEKQILGMQWLSDLCDTFLSGIDIDTTSRIGGSIHFFLYDTLKIFILLSVLIFCISFIQSYFPPARTKKMLKRVKGIWANTAAALLGTVTPFCSCSSIPLFIGFSSAGLPVGVTFSFLISSPLVDLASLIILTSIFGWKIALAYVVIGLLLAVLGGTLIEKLNMERYVESFIKNALQSSVDAPVPSLKERLAYAGRQLKSTVKKVFWYLIIGVAIGAIIHNWIPTEWIQYILGKDNPFSVLIATIVGIPMYADIFGTIPIAEALFAKGVGIGTVLSFIMAVTALSLPSMIMIKKAVKMPLLITFIAIVTTGIIFIGYFFNAVQFLLI